MAMLCGLEPFLSESNSVLRVFPPSIFAEYISILHSRMSRGTNIEPSHLIGLQWTVRFCVSRLLGMVQILQDPGALMQPETRSTGKRH